MKEFDAKQKWCPFAIGQGQTVQGMLLGATNGFTVAVASINRQQGGQAHSDCKCLGNDCMSWVWTSTEQDDGFCSLLDDNSQE